MKLGLDEFLVRGWHEFLQEKGGKNPTGELSISPGTKMCRGMRSSGSARTVPALLLSLNLPLLQAAGKGGKNRETGNSLGRLKAGFKSTSPVCALIGVRVFWSKKREWIPRWGSVSSGTGDY